MCTLYYILLPDYAQHITTCPPGFSDLPTALGGASVVDIPAPPENQMISYLIVSSLLSKAANLIVIWTRNAVHGENILCYYSCLAFHKFITSRIPLFDDEKRQYCKRVLPCHLPLTSKMSNFDKILNA